MFDASGQLVTPFVAATMASQGPGNIMLILVVHDHEAGLGTVGVGMPLPRGFWSEDVSDECADELLEALAAAHARVRETRRRALMNRRGN